MALIQCPECGNKISNKAINCPNCGFPMAKKLKKERDEIRMSGIAKSVNLLSGIIGFFIILTVLGSKKGIIANLDASIIGVTLFGAAIMGFIAVNKDQWVLGILSVITYSLCMGFSLKKLHIIKAYFFIELLSGASGLLTAYQFRKKRNRIERSEK